MASIAHQLLTDLEPEACQDMPAEQRLFCLAVMVLASIPYVFVGAAARWWVG